MSNSATEVIAEIFMRSGKEDESVTVAESLADLWAAGDWKAEKIVAAAWRPKESE